LRTSQVKAFYQKHIHPNNAVLLVMGDFKVEDMMTQIQERFGSWERGDLDPDPSTPVTFTAKGKIRVVHKPDATQAFIHLNHWARPCDHPDFYAYRLMNYILGGGGFTSRLMQSVRSQEGKTYGIRSTYTANTDYGTLTIQTATRNQEFLSTYQLIRSVLSDLVEQGITPAELHKAQAYYAGAIPLQLETPDTIAQKVLTGALNGFTLEDLSQEVNRLKRVQVSDVNRVIKQYLNPDTFNVVIVGNAKALTEQLKQIGPYERVHYRSNPK
jgi:zinc protease